MKRLLLCVLSAMAVEAQSISVTQPAANAALSGASGNYFQVSLASAPSVAKVCYTVDVYPAYNPGIDAITALGCSLTPPFSYPFNTFWNSNGPHQVVATAYDSLGNVVAASVAVPFSIANQWPLSYVASMTVATGTALTSPWVGLVTVTPTFTGTGVGSDSLSTILYVDGINQFSLSGTAASQTFSLDTTQFPNGNHNVCLQMTDNTGGVTYPGHYSGAAGEWCRAINFQNGVTAARAIASASKIWLAPGGTYTLTANILNTDGTTSSTTPVFTSSNPSLATVGQSSGVITAASSLTNGIASSTTINVMSPTFTATNLQTDGASTDIVYTASGPGFTPKMKGWLLQITGGTNWTPAIYTITAVGGGCLCYAILNAAAATTSATSGQFSTGPTAQEWVFVWPTNELPYIGSDGVNHTSYNAASAQAIHSMFASINLISGGDQPYNPGAAAQFGTSGVHWAFEQGSTCSLCTVSDTTPNASGYTAWQSNLNSYVSLNAGYLAGYNNLRLYLIGTAWLNDGAPIYGASTGPASALSPPAFQYTIQQWASETNSLGQRIVIGMNGLDEGNANGLGNWPLQGPIVYGAGTNQSWLQSVTALSGTCTASVGGPNGYAFAFNNNFIIHGSSVSGMNSVAPAVYQATASGNNFTFPCSSVANGTYNSSNDSGLVLEPNAYKWVASNTAYVTSGAFAALKTQQLAASPTFPMSLSVIGDSVCPWFANWQGNGTQSQGSIAQWGQYSDFYPENGNTTYLVSRFAASSLLTSGNIGYQLKLFYGCYNPSLPLSSITQGTLNYVGLPNYPVSVTSMAGNLITFSAAHGITNILPGITRLIVSGATDGSGAVDTGNEAFYIDSCPTPITCTVLLGGVDFTGTGTGGTITWPDATTTSLTDISAAVNASGVSNTYGVGTPVGSGPGGGQLLGDYFDYSGSISSTLSRRRGQTFTLSGVTGTTTPTANCLIPGNCGWNLLTYGRTFKLLIENLNTTTPPNTRLFEREVPILNATGGAATISPDNNYHRGISNAVTLGDVNPAWGFGNSTECLINRCSMERIYQAQPYISGYSDQIGMVSSTVVGGASSFNFSTIGQEVMHQHFETGPARPLFQAHLNAALLWDRYLKYIDQPSLNAPDYTAQGLDCAARTGSYGNLLICLNVTDGPQTVTLNLSPYLQSGQQIIEQTANDHLIGPDTILSAGTTATSVTLQGLDAVYLIFPASFAAELSQPAIAARLADVPNATKIVVRYGYDRYYLDAAVGNDFDCGTGACTPPWDRNVGTLYYRLIYLGPTLQVLATSDVQTL